MKTIGLYLIRNEVDLIEINLRHHFATAIDSAIVVDNGSSDGTFERVAALANDFPIRLTSEPGPYDQSARVTAMARAAYEEGADWLLPVDADEFWLGVDGPLRSIIAATSSDVTILQAEVVNFVQARKVMAADPSSLLSMTMRPAHQVGPIELCEELVESESIGFVEMMYPPKAVRRTHADLVIPPGNHWVSGASSPETTTGQVVCLHAPLRARSLLTGKIDQGRRVLEEDPDRQDYWHVRRWWRLARQGAMDAEWAANSYQDGSLLVAGTPRGLIQDIRLRDAISSFVPLVDPVDRGMANAVDPSMAAFQLAIGSVPGHLSGVDVGLLEAVSNAQVDHEVRGDLLAVGLESIRGAVLMGYLPVGGVERTVVAWGLDADRPGELPPGVTQSSAEEVLLGYYAHFHATPPEVVAAPSAGGSDGSYRLILLPVHGDEGRMVDELGEAERLLTAGGIIVLDHHGIETGKVRQTRWWEVSLQSGLLPLAMTGHTVYGTWGDGPVAWSQELDLAQVARS